MNDIPPASPDFSCPHCARNFNSRIGRIGHLRIHRTKAGEPVPGALTYSQRARLHCPYCSRTFTHRMSLLGHMRLHDNLRSGDPDGLIDFCTSFHGSSLCRFILGEVLPGHQIDLMSLQRLLQSVHLPQHGVDAEDAGPSQDFCVRDTILPSQLQYSAEADEMEVIQLPGLARVARPGLHSVKECRQDEGLVHLQFGVWVDTMAIPNRGLQTGPAVLVDVRWDCVRSRCFPVGTLLQGPGVFW
ncbi:unnamed protein product [Schistocephalus solidus]|uniref:C2H2-type domain-containing protein n=1 Tax=Schistocephalus solidus TaxID=70667 RepID=A0A183SNQ6_SCHSO|nr:unnamed protein product [Schistocephalus solidus]